jgi:AraC-like DNA-binding protein
MDKISSVIGRYSFSARVFFNGDFCDSTQFEPDGVSGHLHLVRCGTAVFSHENEPAIRVDRPTMVFYPRGTRHKLDIPEGDSATLLCATISFQDGAHNLVARMLPECLHVSLDALPAIGLTLELLFGEAASEREGGTVILDRLCDVLMIQMIRHQFESGRLSLGLLAGLADPQLSLVLEAIHERAHEPWQLQELARLASMSRASFTEHFRHVVGTPPGEYLARWRIALGQRLLRQGLPVKVVGARVGYASAPAFTRAFTQHTGLSPRQWLREAGLATPP